MVVRYQKVQNLGLWRKKVKEMIFNRTVILCIDNSADND
jgi:hypothetical protein